MIRPCPTCDGSEITAAGWASLASSCPTCVDMPRLKCWACSGPHDRPCKVCGGRGWVKPDPETVIRWCVIHDAQVVRGLEVCWVVRWSVQSDWKQPCLVKWVPVPEPLEEV